MSSCECVCRCVCLTGCVYRLIVCVGGCLAVSVDRCGCLAVCVKSTTVDQLRNHYNNNIYLGWGELVFSRAAWRGWENGSAELSLH